MIKGVIHSLNHSFTNCLRSADHCLILCPRLLFPHHFGLQPVSLVMSCAPLGLGTCWGFCLECSCHPHAFLPGGILPSSNASSWGLLSQNVLHVPCSLGFPTLSMPRQSQVLGCLSPIQPGGTSSKAGVSFITVSLLPRT